jgi:hypothetical protein
MRVVVRQPPGKGRSRTEVVVLQGQEIKGEYNDCVTFEHNIKYDEEHDNDWTLVSSSSSLSSSSSSSQPLQRCCR